MIRHVVVVYPRDGQRGAICVHGVWNSYSAAKAYADKANEDCDMLTAEAMSVDDKTDVHDEWKSI